VKGARTNQCKGKGAIARLMKERVEAKGGPLVDWGCLGGGMEGWSEYFLKLMRGVCYKHEWEAET